MAVTEEETASNLSDSSSSGSAMRVQKRDKSLQPVDVNKIVRAVERCATGLAGVDPLRIATRTISGLHDGATTTELLSLIHISEPTRPY